MKKTKYAKGNDEEILWCWKCKKKIRKGKLIYMILDESGNLDGSGKFTCKKCSTKQ